MKTQYAVSPDGQRIAYDVCGKGEAMVLLHGGGGSRDIWHEVGYVDRLKDSFRIVTIDLLGHGESDQPVDPACYAIDRQKAQILAVVDDCEIGPFILWGMSYGGNVGRYLAAGSERVTRFIMMGTKLGPGAPEPTGSEVRAFMEHWPPILEAQRSGTLEQITLSEEDREFLDSFNVPAIMAWGQAMLEWPELGPGDFHCPVLWAVGTEDEDVMANARGYEAALAQSPVILHHFKGLDHNQVMDDIDQVFPTFLQFIGA